MIAIPCHNCSHMIEVEVSTIELVETTGFGLLCQSCQEEVKINQRNKKLNKVLNKGFIQRIKEWLVNIVNSVK